VIRAVVGVGVCGGEEIVARFVSIFDELGAVAAHFFLSSFFSATVGGSVGWSIQAVVARYHV